MRKAGWLVGWLVPNPQNKASEKGLLLDRAHAHALVQDLHLTLLSWNRETVVHTQKQIHGDFLSFP